MVQVISIINQSTPVSIEVDVPQGSSQHQPQGHQQREEFPVSSHRECQWSQQCYR